MRGLRAWLRAPFGFDEARWREIGGWRDVAGGGLVLLLLTGVIATCRYAPALAAERGPADCRRSSTLPAADLVGPARVVDGDTLCVQGRSVRLKGIDAPERDDARGPASTASLRRLIRSRVVRCQPQELDRFDRVVAWCSVGGHDLGRAQIKAGHARRWARFDEGRYAGGLRPQTPAASPVSSVESWRGSGR